jgi:hypothetical protein
MDAMFCGAYAFNQSLDAWNMQRAPTIDGMFCQTLALTNLPYGWLLDARSSFPTDRAMNMRAKDVFQGNPVFEKWFHSKVKTGTSLYAFFHDVNPAYYIAANVDSSVTYMDRHPHKVPKASPPRTHGTSTFRDRTYDLAIGNRGREIATNPGTLAHILSYLGDLGPSFSKRQHGRLLQQARRELATNPTGAAPAAHAQTQRQRPGNVPTPRASRKRGREYSEVD